MEPIKQYIAKQFVGNIYRFTCDCLLKLDVTGKVLDYEINNGEIIFHVDVDKKIVKIGINHPNLTIKEL